jgi:hydrogenase maturation protein HypF
VRFRPFVYNLAKRIGIRGFILNSSSGVTIEAEGSGAALEEFQRAVRTDHPTLARIEGMSTTELLRLGDTGFEIRESLSVEGDFVLVSPDVAACQDCLLDLRSAFHRIRCIAELLQSLLRGISRRCNSLLFRNSLFFLHVDLPASVTTRSI